MAVEEKEIMRFYEIKSTIVDGSKEYIDPSRIRSLIRGFVEEEGGLEVAVGGNYVRHDPTPEAGPYGNPHGTTYDATMQIYQVHGCTIKVYGDWITRWNVENRFQITIFGRSDAVDKIVECLDTKLGDVPHD